MEDDTAALLIMLSFLVALISIPLLVLLATFSCIAWAKTRTWKKEKTRRAAQINHDVEMEGLVEECEDDLDSVFSDDDVDADVKAREEISKPDWDLRTSQKFVKELKRAWSGAEAKELAQKKEREERAKMAKALAKEMIRAERRRARRTTKQHEYDHQAGSALEAALPTYDSATAAGGDRKSSS